MGETEGVPSTGVAVAVRVGAGGVAVAAKRPVAVLPGKEALPAGGEGVSEAPRPVPLGVAVAAWALGVLWWRPGPPEVGVATAQGERVAAAGEGVEAAAREALEEAVAVPAAGAAAAASPEPADAEGAAREAEAQEVAVEWR